MDITQNTDEKLYQKQKEMANLSMSSFSALAKDLKDHEWKLIE